MKPTKRPTKRRNRPRRNRPRRNNPDTTNTTKPKSRNDVLIKRYTTILNKDPRETFAFRRLLNLYRERDGDTNVFEADLKKRISDDATAFAPRMLLGHLLKSQRKGTEARVLYEQAAKLAPKKAAPYIAMAAISRSASKYADARTALSEALKRTTESAAKLELLRELGEVALDQEDYEGARTYYGQASAGSSSSVYLRTEYARALVTRSKNALAVAEYKRVLGRLRGDNRVLGPVLREMGQAQLDSGDTEGAIKTLERALRLVGRSSGVRTEINDVIVEAYRREDRLLEFAKSLSKARDYESLALRGKIYDELGDEEEAQKAYRGALRVNRKDIDIRVRIIQLLSRSGKIEEVIKEYGQLIKVAPREPKFVVELAQLLMQVGKRKEAMALAAKTSRKYRREGSVHQALAELYTVWGEDALATKEMAILVKADPRDASHLVALGEQQLSEGKLDAARATWKRILSVEKDRARAHATVAAVLADHDMLDEADVHYRKALKLKKNNLDYVRGLANVLERPRKSESSTQRRSRDAEAIQLWQKVVSLSGADRASKREARTRTVNILKRRGELSTEIKKWSAAFKATPPDIEAGRYLAEAHLRSREPKKADVVLAKIIELAPGDTESLLALERVRTTQGDLSGAIEVLERLVRADPQRSSRYLQRMARYSHSLYRDTDAIRYAEKAVSLLPDDAEGHRRLGDLYRARQEVKPAIASYKRAIELNDRLYETYFDLAELYLVQGESANADRLFRSVMKGSPDDELVTRAVHAATQLHLGPGTLTELEQDLLPLALAHPGRPVFRKLVVELYETLTAPHIQQVTAGVDAAEIKKSQEELRRLGKRALKPLLEALGDDNTAQRNVAIEILAHMRNPNAAEPLLAVAMAKVDTISIDTASRLQAMLAAAAVADASMVPRFSELAEGEDRLLRNISVWALARLADRRSIPVLKRVFQKGDGHARAFAAIGLGMLRDKTSVKALGKVAVTEVNQELRAAASWALGRIGDKAAVPALVAALTSDGWVASAAAQALGRIGDPSAISALSNTLFHPLPKLRLTAAHALAQIDIKSKDEVVLPHPVGRLSIRTYLPSLINKDTSKLPYVDLSRFESALRESVTTSLSGPVEELVAVLSALRPPASGWVIGLSPFTQGIDSWTPEQRKQCRLWLASFGKPLRDELVARASHPDDEARALAVALLARSEVSSAEVAALRAALADGDPAVRQAALVSIPKGVSTDVALAIAEIAENHGEWVSRLRATQTLVRLADPATEPALIRVLKNDAYAFVREAACSALAEIDGPAGKEALKLAESSDTEKKVREAAKKALLGRNSSQD